MRWLFIAVLALAGVVVSGPAIAANGGVSYNVDVQGAFQMVIVRQDPGVTWTFTTGNLSSGADTVLHVQNDDDPQGGFIAGNDDYGGTLASQVVVSPISTTRWLRVIVRRYAQWDSGTCDLTGTPSSGQGFYYSQIPLGGDIYWMGALAAGAHVTTAEVQGGTPDTVELVVDASNPAHAIAFDDDDGVGFMAWAHLPEACSNGCYAVLANFSFSAPDANTNLFWDEDADTTDYDSDGLGESLETFLGTDPNVADTDQDGINDGDEVLGRNETASPNWTPVKFPYMGADVLSQDLFMELDWEQCTDPSCQGNLDLGQFGSVSDAGDVVAQTDALVAQIEADLAPLHVHLDIGRTNTDPNTWFNWGNWGGARRGEYTGGTGNGNNISGCDGYSAERAYLFHFGVTFAGYIGHAWYLPGSCVVATNYPSVSGDRFTPARTLTHETGHSLGLTHGGRPYVNSVNYKPQYESLMNYSYQWTAPAFSHGTAPVSQLNPTVMDETAGVGAVDQTVLTTIQTNLCAGGGCVNFSTGAVDWNRDGIFSPSGTPVRAPASLADYSLYGAAEFSGGLNDAAMSWVTVGGNFGDQLWMFGRNSSDGTLQYAEASKTSLNLTGCGTFQNMNSDGPITNCAGIAPASSVSGETLAFGPGAAELGLGQIMLVVQRPSSALGAQVVTIDSSTGAASFGPIIDLPGEYVADGDVTALSYYGGQMLVVWAPVGSRLKQWVYQNGAWQVPSDAQWSDGTLISPAFGVGATVGYLPDLDAGPLTVMAIPTAPDGTIELAVQGTNGEWTKLSPWSQIGSQPMAAGRPGLAYQFQPGQPTYVGRYYLAFTQTSCSGPYGTPPCYQPLLETQGNRTSGTTQLLEWTQSHVYSDSSHFNFLGGMVLLDDPIRDANLRGFGTLDNTNGAFAPIADGIMNGTMSDLDDYSYITGALRAALGLDGGSWPGGILPPNLP